MSGLALEEPRALADPVRIRSAERPSFVEHHLTVGAPSGPDRGSLAEALDALAAAVAAKGIAPFQEKLYGSREARREILDVRARACERHGLDAATPITFVEVEPFGESPLAGAQLWGVTPRRGTRVATLVGSAPGRVLEAPGFRLAHLAQVVGSDVQGRLAGDGPSQADRMFSNAEAALAGRGLGYGQVVRTWIYAARLLDWYGDLNRVRLAHYTPFGFSARPGGRPFPASTGIQGRSGEAACFMDVLALEVETPGAVVSRPLLASSRQGESMGYGSSFSRGAVLAVEGRSTVLVSGTASIDRSGKTVHVGDREGQAVETLLCVGALLEEAGGDLSRIAASTLFCKDRESLEAWQRVTRLLGVPDFPCVPVLADVCRHDLLLELEAIALV